MGNLLPVLEIPEDLLKRPGALDPLELFSSLRAKGEAIQKNLALQNPDCRVGLRPPRNDGEKEIWMEIGFGNGEHLATLLHRYPNINFIGVEPYVNGMAAFLKNIKDEDHKNIRVLMDDALLLIEALIPCSLDRLFILNPDPWPKKRHHKRRIIQPSTLDAFARVLAPGAELVTATDVDDMAEWIVTHGTRHPAFEWTARSAEDWRTPPPEWIETRYAMKGRHAGRRQTFLIFRKILT